MEAGDESSYVAFLCEVLLDADPDPLQGRLPLLGSLVELGLQPLDVLQDRMCHMDPERLNTPTT